MSLVIRILRLKGYLTAKAPTKCAINAHPPPLSDQLAKLVDFP